MLTRKHAAHTSNKAQNVHVKLYKDRALGIQLVSASLVQMYKQMVVRSAYAKVQNTSNLSQKAAAARRLQCQPPVLGTIDVLRVRTI